MLLSAFLVLGAGACSAKGAGWRLRETKNQEVPILTPLFASAINGAESEQYCLRDAAGHVANFSESQDLSEAASTLFEWFDDEDTIRAGENLSQSDFETVLQRELQETEVGAQLFQDPTSEAAQMALRELLKGDPSASGVVLFSSDTEALGDAGAVVSGHYGSAKIGYTRVYALWGDSVDAIAALASCLTQNHGTVIDALPMSQQDDIAFLASPTMDGHPLTSPLATYFPDNSRGSILAALQASPEWPDAIPEIGKVLHSRSGDSEQLQGHLVAERCSLLEGDGIDRLIILDVPSQLGHEFGVFNGEGLGAGFPNRVANVRRQSSQQLNWQTTPIVDGAFVLKLRRRHRFSTTSERGVGASHRVRQLQQLEQVGYPIAAHVSAIDEESDACFAEHLASTFEPLGDQEDVMLATRIIYHRMKQRGLAEEAIARAIRRSVERLFEHIEISGLVPADPSLAFTFTKGGVANGAMTPKALRIGFNDVGYLVDETTPQAFAELRERLLIGLENVEATVDRVLRALDAKQGPN